MDLRGNVAISQVNRTTLYFPDSLREVHDFLPCALENPVAFHLIYLFRQEILLKITKNYALKETELQSTGTNVFPARHPHTTWVRDWYLEVWS